MSLLFLLSVSTEPFQPESSLYAVNTPVTSVTSSIKYFIKDIFTLMDLFMLQRDVFESYFPLHDAIVIIASPVHLLPSQTYTQTWKSIYDHNKKTLTSGFVGPLFLRWQDRWVGGG